MPNVCLFDILELSEDALGKVLKKASLRTIVRLATAYPRAAGRSLLDAVGATMSPSTFDRVREELNTTQTPSFPQIKQAESELMNIVRSEHLLTSVLPR